MNTKIVIVFLGVLLVILVALNLSNLPASEPIGSVSETNQYNATSTWPSTTFPTDDGWVTNVPKILKIGGGTLGSVVILGAGAGQIDFYDATTTNANLRTKTGTTTILSIPPSLAAGTYTFDLSFGTGLIMEMIGTAPTSTVTYR